jgi:hypothetical protein
MVRRSEREGGVVGGRRGGGARGRKVRKSRLSGEKAGCRRMRTRMRTWLVDDFRTSDDDEDGKGGFEVGLDGQGGTKGGEPKRVICSGTDTRGDS